MKKELIELFNNYNLLLHEKELYVIRIHEAKEHIEFQQKNVKNFNIGYGRTKYKAGSLFNAYRNYIISMKRIFNFKDALNCEYNDFNRLRIEYNENKLKFHLKYGIEYKITK